MKLSIHLYVVPWLKINLAVGTALHFLAMVSMSCHDNAGTVTQTHHSTQYVLPNCGKIHFILFGSIVQIMFGEHKSRSISLRIFASLLVAYNPCGPNTVRSILISNTPIMVLQPVATRVNVHYYYYWYSAIGPVWAETRVQSGDWYSSGTLHPGQVLRGSLPLLSPAF